MSVFEDTLSDQGCVSASSLNSESGYLSDDRCHTAPPRLHALFDKEKGSIQTVTNYPRSSKKISRSTDNVTMIDLNTNEAEKDETKKVRLFKVANKSRNLFPLVRSIELRWRTLGVKP